MLQDEEDIEDQTKGSKSKLGRVAKEGDPIVVVVGVKHHLQDGEETTHEVKEDVADRPSDGGLALVVHVCL